MDMKLAINDWVKIGGYVIGILAVLFGYKAATAPTSTTNFSLPVRQVRQSVSEDTVKLHQELDELKQQLAELKAVKEEAKAVPVKVEEAPKPEPKVEEAPKSVPVPDTGEISWQYDEQEAKDLARKLHRPLAIAFATDGCQICEEVKKFTYPDKQVWKTVHSRFVPLWMYVNGGNPNAQAAAHEYQISRYPRFVVDYLDGSKPEVFMPSPDPRKFMSQLP